MSTNNQKYFDINYYGRSIDEKKEHAERFGNIKPGLLYGTNIKFKGRDDEYIGDSGRCEAENV